jgi:NAD(P)-dependent dehydrogenase (short-subunit alcohol dehydrogenase family)
MLLEDRTGIVSGIGPGMGRDISLALAREGANLVLGARTEERLREVAAEVEGLGRKAAWVSTDVTDNGQCVALAAKAIETFGSIDVLVNNAFIQPPLKRIEYDDIDQWRKSHEVNVIGSLQMTRAVIEQMKQQGSGSIVFINSMTIRNPGEKLGAYSATKAALLLMARTLARELGEYGIRVNTVVPGYIWGPNLKWYFRYLSEKDGRTVEEIYGEVAAETALGKLPTSEEIADAVVFFASDMARAITGQSLDVNAGHHFD